MVDVTAGQGGAGASGKFPSLSEIGDILKRGDLALAFGVLTILVVLILPLPSIVLDLFLAISITVSILILMTVAVHPGAAGILGVSDRAADLDHAAAVAEHGLHPADPVAWP